MNIINLINTCVYFFALAAKMFVLNVGNNPSVEQNYIICKCP